MTTVSGTKTFRIDATYTQVIWFRSEFDNHQLPVPDLGFSKLKQSSHTFYDEECFTVTSKSSQPSSMSVIHQHAWLQIPGTVRRYAGYKVFTALAKCQYCGRLIILDQFDVFYK